MTVRALVLALPALLLGTALASAADPQDGKVSSSSPRVEWKGESNGYLYYNYQRVSRTGGQQPRCDAPACDTFTLEVADSADLTISATYETTVFLDFDIILPDGSSLWIDGSDESNTTVAKIKKAKPGKYVIRVTTNGNASQDGAYTAFAQLAVPAQPGPPAGGGGGTRPPPSQGTPPSSGQPPAPPAPGSNNPQPAPSSAQLSIRTRSAKVRKLKKRKLTVKLSTTAPLTNVRVFLRKGKKIVAKGRLAKLSGSGKAKIRLSKKVKPGRYVLAASGRTQSGGLAAGSAPFKLKR